jgi:GntR family transcriptional regulator/MocR family aminotransferase
MPSKRAFAEHLGVSVITIETVYMQLVSEGYLFSKERSGFYVCDIDIPPKDRYKYKVTPLLETSPSSSSQTDFQFSSFARIMRRVISDYQEKLLLQPPHYGCPELRNAICLHLARYRGMIVSPENIIIGSGAEYLYGLIAQLFPSDTVFGIEYPSYEKIYMVYRAYEAKTELLAMDNYGISDEALAHTKATVLHVTPYHSYPSGISAPASKRYSYISWAISHGAYIIEDDFDSEFSLSRRPLQTVYSMDTSGSVIYINTFSKSLAPSIRIGYMILPDGLTEEYKRKLGFYSCTVPAFDQYVLAEYINKGYFERHLNRIRRKLRQEAGIQPLSDNSSSSDSSK